MKIKLKIEKLIYTNITGNLLYYYQFSRWPSWSQTGRIRRNKFNIG